MTRIECYSQAQGNDQENDAENNQVQPPEPRTVSLRLLAKSYRSGIVWLSRLDLLRLETFLGVVLGNHGGNTCEKQHGIEGESRSVYASQTIYSVSAARDGSFGNDSECGAGSDINEENWSRSERRSDEAQSAK